MRDDTLYTTISSPDRKSRSERLIVLQRQIARGKPLERTLPRWRMLAGIGVALLVGSAMCACAGGMVLGFIGH